MNKFLRNAAIAATALALVAVAPLASRAQVPSVPGPYNIDLGAVLKFTLQTAATIYSPTGSTYTATPTNLAYRGLVCTLNPTNGSGSPSVAWGIQQYDAASQTWFTLLTQTAVGTGASPQMPPLSVVEVRPGIAVSSLPTNMAAANLVIPRVWRVFLTVEGTLGPAVTGTVGCNFTQ